MDIDEVVKKLSFDGVVEMCKLCEHFVTCVQPFNRECGVLKSIVSEVLKEDEENENVVNMDEMQRNVMIGLLKARKECMEDGVLTAGGCVAVIDALFYLVKEKSIMVGIDMGFSGGDSTGG